jgi:transcriptional regulator with XRE-family HTH domain
MFSPAQSRGARGILEWTQGRLATEAGVSLSTVKDFEAGRRTPIGNNLSAMQRAFEAAGIEFIPEDGGGPGVRFQKGLASAATSAASASKKPAGTEEVPRKSSRPKRRK